MRESSARRDARLDVVVPVWNREDTVEQTIRAVLDQTMRELCLIVVDDGSTDRTTDVVRSITDDRLVLVCQENAGPGAARNAGASVGSAPWIAFLDCDDEPGPEWAAALRTDDPGVGTIGVIGDRTRSGRYFRQTHDERHVGAVRFLGGTFSVRRDVFEAVGGYDSAMRYSENTELGIRVTTECERRGLKMVLDDRPLITIHDAPDGRSLSFTPERQCAGAETILTRHHEVLARDSRQLASYYAITGLCAMRNGDRPLARRRLRGAVRHAPLAWRYWARLAQAWVDPRRR